MDKPTKYILFFTPRSGSTWLMQMLRDTQRMGNPNEWYNPENIDKNMEMFKTDNIVDYTNKLMRFAVTPNQVFGVELTSIHFDMYIKDNVVDSFTDDRTVYFLLTRGDMIAQAISLWTAVATNVFHSPQGVQNLDKLEYSKSEIQKWLRHIVKQEQRLHEIFSEYNILPIRFTYEQMVANPDFIIKLMASPFEEVRKLGTISSDNSFKKLSGMRSSEFAQRFQAESYKFCLEWYKSRPW